MSLKRTIESLFPKDSDDEFAQRTEAFKNTDAPQELKKIENPFSGSTEKIEPDLNLALELPTKEFETLYQEIFGDLDETKVEKIEEPKTNFEDLRKQKRVNIASKRVGVRFQNKQHFAKQYIENISSGGLYIRTSEDFKTGDLVHLEFNVPDPTQSDQELRFTLVGSICRTDENGVGLQFTNLDQEARYQLEKYVHSVLSDGVQVNSQPKSTVMAKIEERRLLRRTQQNKRKQSLRKIGILVVLAAINAYLGFYAYRDFSTPSSGLPTKYVFLNGKQIEIESINSFAKDSEGKFWLEWNGNRFEITNLSNFQKQLPVHLRHQLDVMNGLTPKNQSRRNKNAPNITQTR
ncbi:MAG: PilZ domain-containing protein [Bdellovibrionota bacterium]